MEREFCRIFGVFFSMSLFLVAFCADAAAQTPRSCGKKKADRLLQSAQISFEKQDFIRALAFYEEAGRAAPKCPTPVFQKGATLARLKKYDEAVGVYQEAQRLKSPESFLIDYAICEARFEQKNFQEAVKSCRESARQNNNHYRTFYLLSWSHIALGQPDKALETATRAVEIEPKAVEALLTRARLFSDLKKYDAAVDDLKKASAIAPDNEEVQQLLFANYSHLKKFDDALSVAQRLYERNPKSFTAIKLKAAALGDLGRYGEALPLANEAIKMQPDDKGVITILGTVYHGLKNSAKAVEYLSQAVQLNPDFFEGWLLLSAAHLQNSADLEKAELAALEAVRLRPEDGNANYLLAVSQWLAGKPEPSLKSFDAAIKNNAVRSVSAAVYKGFALINLKRQAEAEKAFQQAFALRPGNKSDYFALAEIQMYRWDLDKTRAELRKAIDFAEDDEDDDAYGFLSWTYILGGSSNQAIIAANEAIEQNPKLQGGYTNRCRAFNESNLPDIAIRDCRKALVMRPGDGEVLFYLGRSYALKKDAAQEKAFNRQTIAALERKLNFSGGAARTTNAAPTTSNEPSARSESAAGIGSLNYNYDLYLLASAYFLDNNFEAAARTYEKVVEMNPRFPRLRYNLAVAYLRLKRPNPANARAQYQALLKLDPKMAADLKKIFGRYKAKITK